jgi:cell division protein ZapE
MNDMKRNAVLRFITLIDTLYDNGARVVISAAAPPDQLYTGDEHAEVFRRTVSRLMEMQSKAYMDR